MDNPSFSKRWITGVALTAVLASGVFLGTAMSPRGVDAQETASPTAVAVVDLNTVITDSKQFAALQAEQAKRQEDLKTDIQTRQGEVEKLRSDRDLLAPGSDAYEAKTQELLEKGSSLQAYGQLAEQLEAGRRGREFLQLYEAANAAAGAVAQDRGIDVVMVKGTLPDMQQLARLNAQQITAVLQNRKVLYAADGVDITQATLARMNADF